MQSSVVNPKKSPPPLSPDIKKYEPENNPFYTLVADITHRCNMSCKNCYIPNRKIKDMDIDKLYSVLGRLPARTEIRLIGAEPTMRRDLPDIIHKVRQYGHRPVLMTNGLKLSSEEYIKTLKDAGLKTVYISMNGVDNDEWYQKMDEMTCAKQKIQALKNAYDCKMFVSTGCIIVRNINLSAPARFLKLIEKMGIKKITMRFRNIGQIGRYDNIADGANLSLKELIGVISKSFNISEDYINNQNKISGYFEKNTRFFYLPNSFISVKITNWDKDGLFTVDPKSKRRGRITNDFKISSFFEDVKINEFGY